MSKVAYGNTFIHYSFHEASNLRTHYISVDNERGVVLKGKPISEAVANKLILKKASWITKKLHLVDTKWEDVIVSGSRMPYLGKTYYVEVIFNRGYKEAELTFTYSKFVIKINPTVEVQQELRKAFAKFYKAKAEEKIIPRIEKLSAKTKLRYNGIQIRQMNKRWGSCTPKNRIVINVEAIKLPFTLLDYLIVHELCHTKVKDHSKKFWRELSKHVPNWKNLDEKIGNWKL